MSRLAARHGARFLLASTSEVYGDPALHPQGEGYWGNVNPVGPTALRLSTFLKTDRWLFESPTRPLSFLREIPDMPTFERELSAMLERGDRQPARESIMERGHP